ncbi:MAG: MBL fold metallo-hydrolase [Clostridia bacterium]|nr:MBL fold metallo-hydrolase [Clostridia bacterium]
MKEVVQGRRVINTIYIIVILAILFSNFFHKTLSVFLLLNPNYEFNNNTEIHFLDVGQGDAIAIKFDNGEVMLVDSGTQEYNQKLTYYLENLVLDKTKTINYLVLTHIDTDHSANVLSLMKNFNIDVFFRPPNISTYEDLSSMESNNTFDEIIEYASTHNIDTRVNSEGLQLKVGNTELNWLAPTLDTHFNSTNEYSPIIKLEYNGFSALLTGDVSSKIEQVVLEKYSSELDVDILKFAHHGSYNSTSKQFLQATSPEFACISVGENTFGHPSIKTLQRVLEYDQENDTNLFNNLYTTKDKGNVVFELGDKINVSFIENIDDYSFVSYFVYSSIAIVVLLLLMLKPYYYTFRKNRRFIIQNRQYQENAQKNIDSQNVLK